MSKRIDEFLQELFKVSSQTPVAVNVSDLCVRLTTDVIDDLAFGHEFNTQTDETNRFLPITLRSWGRRINMIMQWPVLRIPNVIMLGLRFRETMRIGTAVRDMVKQRMAKDKHALHDFYSVAAGEIEIGDNFIGSEMWPEAVSFLIAGLLPCPHR